MTKIPICILLCLTCLSLRAQLTLGGSSSARSLALGGSGVAYVSAQSGMENQAATLFDESGNVMVSAERILGLAELTVLGAFAQMSSSIGHFGLEINQFGYDDYREQKIGLMYGRKLSDRIALAVQLNYLNLSIVENGNSSTVSFEIAALARLTDDVNIGVQLYSPMPVAISDDLELPSIFRLGAQYAVSEQLRLTADLQKDLDKSPRVHVGVAYQVIEVMELRLGTASGPAELSFGVGLQLKSGIGLDMVTRWNTILGVSPGLTAYYQW